MPPFPLSWGHPPGTEDCPYRGQASSYYSSYCYSSEGNLPAMRVTRRCCGFPPGQVEVGMGSSRRDGRSQGTPSAPGGDRECSSSAA